MATQNGDLKPSGGRRLREWRKAKKLTLAQVGDVLGVTHVHVSNVERGRDRPSLQLAEAIRKMTGGKVPLSSWVDEPAAAAAERGVA